MTSFFDTIARPMIEATEAERLNEKLAAALKAYDDWHPEHGGIGNLRSITEALVQAASVCGWDGLVDPIDWAQERVASL